MTTDFRAKQVQVSKIIPSGSSGTNAKILIYPIEAEDSSAPNTGVIDTSKLNVTLLHNPRQVSDFNLTDNTGKAFTQESLRGHWTMMFFGFTRCPSICPTTMAELGKTYKKLFKDGVRTYPQVMMVSIDPEHDTLKLMNEYVTKFDSQFHGATGDKQQIAKMTKELGIVYMKVTDPNNKDKYDINHSGTIMLFNPQGLLAGFFSMPHKADSIAQDFEIITHQG